MRARHMLGVTGLAAATVIIITTAPAHAATVSAACSSATSKASSAQTSFRSALKSYRKEISEGGHPSVTESRSLQSLESVANKETSAAARACVVTVRTGGPSGAVDTGLGGSVHSASAADVAAGVGLVALAGTSALVVFRRRRLAGTSA